MPASAFFCWSSKASAISTGSTSQENEDSWLRTGFPAFSPHTNLHRSDAICCTKVLMLWDLWWLCGIVERSCCHRRRRNISFTLCRDATLVSKENKVGLFQQWYLEKKFSFKLLWVKLNENMILFTFSVIDTSILLFSYMYLTVPLWLWSGVEVPSLPSSFCDKEKKNVISPPSNLCSTS